LRRRVLWLPVAALWSRYCLLRRVTGGIWHGAGSLKRRQRRVRAPLEKTWGRNAKDRFAILSEYKMMGRGICADRAQ
jgi:hypothetical protein